MNNNNNPAQGSTPSQLGRLAVVLGLILITILGMTLRMGALQSTTVVHPIRADARQYVLYAYNLNNYDIYSLSSSGLDSGTTPKPDAVRTPGYPLFLAAFIKQGSEPEMRRALFWQTLLSGLTILLVFIVCRALLPAGWALAATAMTAISPHLINANVYLLTETLFAFFLTGTFVALYYAAQHRRLSLWLLAGLFIGATAVVRPSIQYFPLLLIGLMALHLPKRELVSSAAVLLVGFLLLFAPWLVRNLLVLGQSSDPTLMINFLHHGMYPGFMFDFNPQSYGFPYRFDPNSAEISKSVSTVLQSIANRFHEQPAEHLRWFLFGKPIIFWSWDIIQGMGGSFVYEVSRTPYADQPLFTITHRIALLMHWPIVALAATGCLMAWLPSAKATLGTLAFPCRILSLLLIYYVGIHIVGAPFPRYSIPLRPLLYIMAAVCAWQLTQTLMNRIQQPKQSAS